MEEEEKEEGVEEEEEEEDREEEEEERRRRWAPNVRGDVAHNQARHLHQLLSLTNACASILQHHIGFGPGGTCR